MARIDLAEWDEVAELIEAALEEPAADRRAFLRLACAGDERRLSTAERLLTMAEEAVRFLDRPADQRLSDLLREAMLASESSGPASLDPTPPEAVGAYRVVREIGRGGMGVVYLGERSDDEYRRSVAIKVVRSGLGAHEAIRRFRRERQILASLDHPNIARLYDGGVTDDGRPYFVMELVEGEPIDRYCDARRLTIGRRLDLFEQVCSAVAYAHRKLVVHRDLKPGNILVDAGGTVKLLDFGVGKLLAADPEVSDAGSPVTRAGFRVMTPEYASPEQFLGGPISTATDVYSLGVLLFELLAGTGPYRLDGEGPRAIEKAVIEDDPSRPSAAVSEDAAQARSSSQDRLRRRLRGDLDTIALEALRKDPDARYPSVAALLEDVRRHRDRRPIVARPPSWRYSAGRFLRRHRVGVSFAALLAASLLAGTGATLWQARVARLEARKAEQIRDFVVGIFEVSDPDVARGEAITARELLDRAADRLELELADQPRVRAEMQTVLGAIYRKLGLYDEALGPLVGALDSRRADGTPPSELAASLGELAALHYDRGEYEEAEALQREVLEIQRREQGASSPAYAAAALDLAGTLRERGEFETARPHYEAALRVQQSAGDSVALSEVLNGFGLMLTQSGEVEEGIQILDRAVRIRRAFLGSMHTEVARTTCNLASAYEGAGRTDEARETYLECLAIRRGLLEADHPDIGRTLNNLAMVYDKQGDLEAADSLLRQALEIRRRAYGEFHPDVAGSINNLAVLAYRRSDYAGAAAAFRDLLAQWRELLGDDHPNTLTTLSNLGMTLFAAGDLEAAEPVLRESLAARSRALGDHHPQTAESHANLAGLLLERGRARDAEAEARSAVAILDAEFPDGHPLTASALSILGQSLRPQGRCGEAVSALERSIEIRVAAFGERHAGTADARYRLGQCLADLGRYPDARTTLQAAWSALVEASGEEHEKTRAARAALDALP